MAYNPLTDFLALLRQTSGGVRTERTPGLDYVVAALARMGLFKLSVSRTAPTSNQATTVWLLPSTPSWVAEGTVFLWNPAAGEYQLATPFLWASLLSLGGYLFQSAVNNTNIVLPGTSVLAIERAAPASTTLVLPSVLAQFVTGRQLSIVDWSTGVTLHDISLTTPDGATIMKRASWDLFSTPDQIASATLRPVPDLNAWIIAP